MTTIINFLNDPPVWWGWLRTIVLAYLLIAHERHRYIIRRMKQRHAATMARMAIERAGGLGAFVNLPRQRNTHDDKGRS